MKTDRLLAMSETVIQDMYAFQEAVRTNDNSLPVLDRALDKILEIRPWVDKGWKHREEDNGY